MSSQDITIPILKPSWLFEAGSPVLSICVQPGLPLGACGLDSGEICFIDLEKGTQSVVLSHHKKGITSLVTSPDETWLAAASEDGSISLLDWASKKLEKQIEIGKDWVNHLTWCPDSKSLLASCGREISEIHISATSARSAHRLTSTVTGLEWLSSTEYGATCYGKLSLFKPGRDAPQKEYAWKGSLTALKFSPSRRFAICGSQDQTIHIWDLKTNEELAMQGFSGKAKAFCFDPEGKNMASASAGEITLWNFEGEGPAGKEALVLGPHQSSVTALAFQNSGNLLASGSRDGILFLWDAGAKNEIPLWIAGIQGQDVNCLSWSQNDTELFAGTATGYLAGYCINS